MASALLQCANIGGTLVAVLAFIAFINGVLVWCGSLVGIEGLTFQYVLGQLFIPAAWLMGVETAVSDDSQLSDFLKGNGRVAIVDFHI